MIVFIFDMCGRVSLRGHAIYLQLELPHIAKFAGAGALFLYVKVELISKSMRLSGRSLPELCAKRWTSNEHTRLIHTVTCGLASYVYLVRSDDSCSNIGASVDTSIYREHAMDFDG